MALQVLISRSCAIMRATACSSAMAVALAGYSVAVRHAAAVPSLLPFSTPSCGLHSWSLLNAVVTTYTKTQYVELRSKYVYGDKAAALRKSAPTGATLHAAARALGGSPFSDKFPSV